MDDKQEYLKNIITRTLTSDDLEAAIGNITMELGKLFNADRVYFKLYDKGMGVFSEVIEEYRKNENIPSAKGEMINLHENEIVFPISYRDELDSAFFITNIESKELLSEQNLEYLMPIARELSIGTHLFKVQNNLNKNKEYEKILREIIMKVTTYENPAKVFEYLVNRLTDVYKADKVLHLQADLPGISLEDEITVINDVEQIENPELKQFLRDNNIEAFMLYPLEKDRIMISSFVPRIWDQEEIESLKLIAGTISIIYSDIITKKEVMEIQETFLASLIHDLRSPILGEQKALEFLMSRKPTTPLQDIAEYHSEMYSTNEDLLNIINNLLGVYSMELGQHEVGKEPTDINNIINDAIRSIKRLADENDVKITVRTQEKLSEIKMDPDEIRRVFINIISNAIKHNPKGISKVY